MAARPHDADDSPGGEPRDEEQGTGSGASDVDRDWQEIVARLQAPDPRSWAPDPVLEEREEHFEPPDPGPVLGGDPLLTLAWGLVVAGPLAFLLALLLPVDVPALVPQLAGAGFVVGIALLLWRMPHHRDEDDDGPGAVV